MSDIQSIFSSYARAITESESQTIQLTSMLKSVLRIVEQNALDLNLNVYERATLKSVTVKLKAIEQDYDNRKTKKIVQPHGTKRFSFGRESRNGRYSGSYAPASSRKADAEQS